MLGHFLTPDHGSASLEPQINTIVVSDNETVIPKIASQRQRAPSSRARTAEED